MSIDFSIVLCTRNRAGLLRDALESALEIEYPSDRFELILVSARISARAPRATARTSSSRGA